MTPELTALALAGLLQMMQYMLVSLPANRELGVNVTAAPRDDGPLIDKLSPKTKRLGLAMNNHFEALILFSMAIAVVTVSGQTGPLTAICAYAYVAARVLYVPAYYFGWAPWRSVIWGVGWIATLLIFLAALI